MSDPVYTEDISFGSDGQFGGEGQESFGQDGQLDFMGGFQAENIENEVPSFLKKKVDIAVKPVNPSTPVVSKPVSNHITITKTTSNPVKKENTNLFTTSPVSSPRTIHTNDNDMCNMDFSTDFTDIAALVRKSQEATIRYQEITHTLLSLATTQYLVPLQELVHAKRGYVDQRHKQLEELKSKLHVLKQSREVLQGKLNCQPFMESIEMKESQCNPLVLVGSNSANTNNKRLRTLESKDSNTSMNPIVLDHNTNPSTMNASNLMNTTNTMKRAPF